MDCTSDINDVPVFVRPTPTARVLPDDYRLQTLTGSAPGNLRRSNHLRLVPVCGSAQRCCSHGTVRTLCYQRRNSSTRSLLSIAEFDGHHSNVDAHSFEIQPTDPCYYSQGDDHGKWKLLGFLFAHLREIDRPNSCHLFANSWAMVVMEAIIN